MTQKGRATPKLSAKGGFAEIVIIVAVLVLAAIGGAYYLGTQKNKTQSTASPSPVAQTSLTPNARQAPNGDLETANWKTYTSQRLKLVFKYPPDCLTPGEREDANGIGMLCFSDNSQNQSYEAFKLTENDLHVVIGQEKNTKNQSLEQIVNSDLEIYVQNYDIRDHLIGGLPAKSFKTKGNPDVNTNYEIYRLLHGSEKVIIVKTPAITSKQSEFDKILSTFKFTP